MSGAPRATPGAPVIVCPHCDTGAEHLWKESVDVVGSEGGTLDIGTCKLCAGTSIWLSWTDFVSRPFGPPLPQRRVQLLFPAAQPSIPPSAHLPTAAANDYLEAARVAPESPRSAAALLRQSLESLLAELGHSEYKLYDSIRAMVDERKMDHRFLRTAESVRIAGNESVHPGQLDINDDPEIVDILFTFVNSIADATIGMDKNIEDLWAKLPPEKTGPVDADAAQESDQDA